MAISGQTDDDPSNFPALTAFAFGSCHRPDTPQAEEVARMAYFLGSDLAGYTTGQLIPVDGGYGL